MWRPRDHERFIGGYDPEYEMPDPDREPGDRWQSRVYRHNARDSRIPYRWNPDRFEERFPDREERDRFFYERGFEQGFQRGYTSAGPRWDRDRAYGSDRGWDRDREPWRR
jgi:hypothetical protein